MKKEKRYYMITAMITMILIVFLYTQIDTFGKTMFTSDSYSQYVALFSKLKSIFSSSSSFFYSFQGGLGDGFLGTFFYYLCSPFNLLVFFFEDMNHCFLAITLLKFITASLTAFYFFRYHFKEEKSIYAIMFSILYVFISFNILHFIHIMWLDAVLMLPLLLVGIDKFIKKKKVLPYVLPLIYTIVTNYYFGYMTCIFSFLYFNYHILLANSIKKEWKKIIKENLVFLGISFLAVLSTSFVLLEVAHYLPGYARTTTEFLNGEAFVFHGNPFDFFESFFIGANTKLDFLNPDNFFLYFSILGFLLIILYFTNPNITIKEKILTSLIIVVLYVSVSGNYFNYMWHGFSKPQFFNGRFTFLFDFFLLYIAMKSITKLSTLTKKSYLISFLFFIIILFVYFFTKKDIFMMYVHLILIAAYLGLLYFIKTDKIYMPIVIVTVAILEVEANALIELGKYGFTNLEDYQRQNITYNAAVKYINEQDNNLFYRIENDVTEPYNGPIYYQYNGIDIFLSTVSDESADFFIDMGLGSGATKKNTISYYSGNKVIDSLFGIKYHIYMNSSNIPNEYTLLTSLDIDGSSIDIYRNPNALALGFMVNKNILTVEKDLNALQYQSKILKAMTNLENSIYIDIPLREEYGTYLFDNNDTKNICFYTAIDSSNGYNNSTLYLNGNNLYKKEDSEIVCTESPEDKNLILSYSNLADSQHLGTFAAYFDEEAWNEIIQSLKEQELTIKEFNGTTIKGIVTSTKDKNILFTTIPYDSNWDVYVDGKKIKTHKLLNALLGIELDEGTFKIEFKYRPKQFYLGMLISFISFTVLFIIDKKKLLQTK